MGMRKCRSHLKATRDLGIPIHLSFTGTGFISVPTPLLGEFYLVLVSTRLDMVFDPLRMLITIWCDLSDISGTKALETPILQDLVKIIIAWGVCYYRNRHGAESMRITPLVVILTTICITQLPLVYSTWRCA